MKKLAACLLLTCLGSTQSAAYNTYFGNLHSHCILSDGIGTADEAFTHARDVADIDVLVLTDHTHLLTASEFTFLLGRATAFTDDGVFVALGCQEFGNLNDFGHINIFDAAFRNPNPTENLTATYSFILAQNAFGAFNHPNPSYGSFFNNLQFYPEYEDAMKAIEIVNGKHSESYEAQFLQALANGWKVGPFGNQDNHQGNWGDQQNTNADGDIYLTGILANSLTRADILEALRARRFFAMEEDPIGDRLELTFQIDEHWMGEEITTGVNPHITATARAQNGTSIFNRFDLFRDGVIIHSQVSIGTQISYDHVDPIADGETHYYFIRASQVDSDRVWSAPIWVTAHLDPSSVAESAPAAPAARLLGGRPNPFSPRTELGFVLPARAANQPYEVRMTVHDLEGALVRDLGVRLCSPGEHFWPWDGRDESGAPLASGVYLYRLSGSGLGPVSARVLLLR